jgi:hypothetical protein
LSDNVTINSMSGGPVISTDDLGGVQVQRVKVQFGVDGTATDVSGSAPMPVDGSGVTQPTTAVAATRPAATVMQNAATANGNGASLPVTGYAVALLNVVSCVAMSGGTTINFEASVDDTTWVAIAAHTIGVNGTLANTTTADGDFRIQTAGYKSVRARISGYSVGTVTVKGYAVASASAPTTVALAGSTSEIGNVKNSGTFAVQVASVVAQGSTTAGQSGELVQGAVTTSAPTYTTAQTAPLSLTTAGALRTDASGTSPATPKAFGAVVALNGSSQSISGTSKDYRGFTIRETANSTAVVVIYDNASAASGTVLEEISLAAGESAREFYAEGGIPTVNGIYVSIVSGTVAGSVRTG